MPATPPDSNRLSAPARVEITAPSRLHFGLLRVGGGERRFGGAGVMVDAPALRLECRAADSFSATGLLSDRMMEFARRWSAFHNANLPDVQLELIACPPQHSGLGVGTQLGLAVASILQAWRRTSQGTAEQIARSVGRGQRSAVGAYGFRLGGFIVERGKTENEFLSPLDLQIDLPEEWRFVLVRPAHRPASVCGVKEQEIFESIQPNSELEDRLVAILRDSLAPAAAQRDFDAFAASVETYGRWAGENFAAIQGGPYNGAYLNDLIVRLREIGARGLGQSSWGPTLFALEANENEAAERARQILKSLGGERLEVTVTRINRGGASIRIEEQGES